MLYSLLRPALFSLDPEDAHGFTLASLDAAQALGLLKLLPRAQGKPVRVMGIDFPNPVGLAAGRQSGAVSPATLAGIRLNYLHHALFTSAPRPVQSRP